MDFTETLACKSTANNSIRKVDIGFDLWLPDRLILLQHCFGYPVKTSPQMWKTPSELNITVINAVINMTLKGTSLPPILVWMSYYVKSKLAQKTKIYYWQRKKESKKHRTLIKFARDLFLPVNFTCWVSEAVAWTNHKVLKPSCSVHCLIW